MEKWKGMRHKGCCPLTSLTSLNFSNFPKESKS